jgi:large subunit ribosomal protein L18
MINKKKNRLRRAMRNRLKLKELNQIRLCVHKTPNHIYAQVISGDGGSVLAAASTLEDNIKKTFNHTGNIPAATLVGKIIAERCINNSVKFVSFDRSGFSFHGRIKALATSAREHGLIF